MILSTPRRYWLYPAPCSNMRSARRRHARLVAAGALCKPAPLVTLSLLLAACSPSGQEDRSQFIASVAMDKTLSTVAPRVAKSSASWPQQQWWRAFRSAELDRVVDKALADNQSLKKTLDTLRETEAKVQVAGSRLLPAAVADMFMRETRYPDNGVVASYNPKQGGLDKTIASINPLSISWELDFWGKNAALLDAALGEASAKASELEQARLVLASGVARAYLRGYVLSRQLEIASELVQLRHTLLELAELRYRTGLDTLDGVQSARASEQAAIRREANARALLTLQQDALARMMGEGPDAARDLFARKTAVAPATPVLPKTLPVELLIHRPDLAAALRLAEAEAERIHVVKTMFLPSFNLSAGTGLEASVTTAKISKLASYLFTPGAIGYAVTPSVNLPIFLGGRLRGNLEAQRASYDQAVDIYNETLLAAAQQVADAAANMNRAAIEYDAQSRAVKAAQGQLEIARIRLRDGLRDNREITQNRADLLDATFVQRTVEGERLIAAVDLYQSLGGGYVDGRPPRPKPAPEEDPITPAVDAIQALGGG